MSKQAKVFLGAALALAVVLFGAISVWLAVNCARQEGRSLKCMNNLREIGRAAVMYADVQGRGYLPHDPEGGAKAFQIIADFLGRDFVPELLICPHSVEEIPAERDASGRWIITEASTSYRWTTKRLKTTDPGPWILVYDKRPHPNVKRCAVFMDGTGGELTEEEFRKALEARER